MNLSVDDYVIILVNNAEYHVVGTIGKITHVNDENAEYFVESLRGYKFADPIIDSWPSKEGRWYKSHQIRRVEPVTGIFTLTPEELIDLLNNEYDETLKSILHVIAVQGRRKGLDSEKIIELVEHNSRLFMDQNRRKWHTREVK